MQHPVTTEYEEARHQVEETLYAVKDFGLPVLWFWPNVDAGSDGTSKGIRVFREREEPDNFHLFRNMFPEDFLRLLLHSTAIVGNSSVAIRECSFLGVPAVNVGSRQQGRERGANVIDVDHDRAAIAGAIRDAPVARQGAARSPLRRRPRRRAHRRLPGDGAADRRKAAHLLMQTGRPMQTTIPADRQARIAALGYDYAAQPQRTARRRATCAAASVLVTLTHRDRYGYPAQASACARCGLVVPQPADDRRGLRPLLRRRLPAARERVPRPPDRRADDSGRAAASTRWTARR